MTSSRSPSGSCSACISKIECRCLLLSKASEQRQTLNLKTLLYSGTGNLKEDSEPKGLSSVTSPPHRLCRWAGTEAVNHLEFSLVILVKVVEHIFEIILMSVSHYHLFLSSLILWMSRLKKTMDRLSCYWYLVLLQEHLA